MELTEELMEEIALAAKEIEFGSVIVSISGQPNDKVVDITTEKRERFRKNSTVPGVVKYEKDTYKKSS